MDPEKNRAPAGPTAVQSASVATSPLPPPALAAVSSKRCASTQAQWPADVCHKCQSQLGPTGEGVGVRAKIPVSPTPAAAAGDASESSSETSDTSEDSSKATSLLNESDARCYGDFLNEDAWLDRMLEQLGLPSDVDKEMTDMMAEECYHKELRDVLWTIVSLKLDDMRLATSQMRAAWKSYVRNTKIVDDMLQNKDRAVRALKEQLVHLKLENKSLRERISESPDEL
ncbi:hypothetical protein IscW_ISCW023405 [Ixodes scapularis]|uniref:Uncharacterized protein n=1 Tax=Ixodes scapularis TaxID=6945 RepID=B7QLM1_IXOSC|nr:hypothetical protein IscW_ISCW023405 [Ixodes scapularis]|eukprot:XP_002416076.1 hypothetical protein IscW_ISCW023405 [Ixodes scapularis]